MGQIERPSCRLSWRVIDAVPPWCPAPETILFHHGIGATGALFSDWVPALCDRYRILLLDTRGFGASTLVSPDAPWDMAVMVSDLLAVAEAERLDRFHLVGESAGGPVALAAAIAGARPPLGPTAGNAPARGR